MENSELAQKLAYIAWMNFDMVRAYEEAIEKAGAGDADIVDHFAAFRDDHRRQAAVISEAIAGLGETPPKPRAGERRMIIDVLNSPAEAHGTEDVLRAMQKNEYFTNKAYSEAIADEYYTTYPLNIQVLFQRSYRDERRHQEYIDATLGRLVEAGR